jgi:hypothetical protein
MKYIFIFIAKVILFLLWLNSLLFYPIACVLYFLWGFKLLKWEDFSPCDSEVVWISDMQRKKYIPLKTPKETLFFLLNLV